MPMNHTGALSGVTYTIPDLDDEADIEVAFTEFADTLPPTPPKISVVHLTAGGVAASMNTLHVVDAATGQTLTLGPGTNDGDLVKVFQTGQGAITLSPTGVQTQGPTVTPGQFGALTAVWVASESKWVIAPFSFSGVRPSESTGGTIVDLNGRRYHIFDVAGENWFYSHADMDVEVWVIGAGGNGAEAGTLPGQGGSPGAIATGTVPVESMMSTRVAVGAAGLAGMSAFLTVRGLNGPNAAVDTPNADDPEVALPADLATVLQDATVGGAGADGVGPLLPMRYGQGGSGAAILKAETARPSHTVTIPGSPGSPGSAGWNERQERGADCTQIPEHHCGDACNNGQCPPNWYASIEYVPPMGTKCTCCTDQWYGGGLWNCTCPSGWNQDYKTCWRDVWHEGTPGTPGTPDSTQTVWDACPSGYQVKPTDTTRCIDQIPAGAGEGGDGCVVIHYPFVVAP